MKFATTAGALRTALLTAGHATPATPSMVAYSGTLLVVKAKQLAVTGSDGETTIASILPVSQSEDGQVLLPPRPLSAYLGTLPVECGISVSYVEGGDVEVRIGERAPYRFRPVAATFPLPPTPKTAPRSVDLSRLGAALAAVKSSVARENPGVQLVSSEEEGLMLHSTDNYRLSRAHLPEAGFGEFSGVLPVGVLDRVASSEITHVAVDTKSRTLRFSGPEVSISARLLSTPFPAVDAVLSTLPDSQAIVPTDEVVRALTRLKAIADQAPIVCRLEHDVLTLTVTNADLGSGMETLTMRSSISAPFEFAVKLSYLSDAISAHKGEEATIAWTGPMAALFLYSKAPLAVTGVVMPVRL